MREKRWAAKTRTGCITCRKRRVKCDERRPSCSRCENHGVSCGGYALCPAPSDIFQSARELYHLHKLHTGAVVGMIDSTNRTVSPSSDRSAESHESLDCRAACAETDSTDSGSTAATSHIIAPATKEVILSLIPSCSHSLDAVDPTRCSALSTVPEAAQIIDFWRLWTLPSPRAAQALAVCMYDDASLAALLSVTSLMMQYSNVCGEAHRNTTSLTVRSLKTFRDRLNINPEFFLTEPGLNTFSWLTLLSWLSGDTSVGRMHMKSLRSLLLLKHRRLEDFPLYIVEVLTYCDFVSAMFTLKAMVFGDVPDILTMKLPNHRPIDALFAWGESALLEEFESFEHRVLNFATIQKAWQGMLTATELFLLMASGDIPCSSYAAAAFTTFKSLGLIFPFAFFSDPPPTQSESGSHPSKQNVTAYLGTLLVLWAYAILSPLGTVNSGGILVFSADAMSRLPPSNVPDVARAFERLNDLGVEARAAVTGTAKEGVSSTKACAQIISILEELAGAEFEVFTALMKHYVVVILSSPSILEVINGKDPDLAPRLKFFGPFIGRWSFIGAF